MRTKEQLLRYIDAQVTDREAGGYADIFLPIEEIQAHRLGVDDLPWWVSIRVTNGDAEALQLPATFVPERAAGDWSVELEHVVNPEAWAALDAPGDYTDALAAAIVDEVSSDDELSFESVDGPYESEDAESFTVLYRLRASADNLADALDRVSALDGAIREVLREEAADASLLYPEA